MSAAELQSRRATLRADLAANRRHLVAILRRPPEGMATLPIGDLLCWCDGLDEAKVTRILAGAGLPWGHRVRRLTARHHALLCWQIKTRHPETWEQWKASARA